MKDPVTRMISKDHLLDHLGAGSPGVGEYAVIHHNTFDEIRVR